MKLTLHSSEALEVWQPLCQWPCAATLVAPTRVCVASELELCFSAEWWRNPKKL